MRSFKNRGFRVILKSRTLAAEYFPSFAKLRAKFNSFAAVEGTVAAEFGAAFLYAVQAEFLNKLFERKDFLLGAIIPAEASNKVHHRFR